MLTTRELQDKIIQLKKEKDVCVLAHAYQSQDILEVADHVGDSYGLSELARTAPQKTLLMCGVRFMAETAKILSPNKTVILSHPAAGCPMAEQIPAEALRRLKEENPGYTAVAYINTTAELKAECDVCVTSASALDIVKNLPADKILFIPDPNLGNWVQGKVNGKTFRFTNGGCPIHGRITEEDVTRERKRHPEALLLVHPECRPEVTAAADYAGSTTGIMNFVRNSNGKEFIIGTENSIVQHLQFEHPDRKFYALSKACICEDMKLTTLAEVYGCLLGQCGEEILLPADRIAKARKSIDAMLTLSKK